MSSRRNTFGPPSCFRGVAWGIRYGLAGAVACALLGGLIPGTYAKGGESPVDPGDVPMEATDAKSSGEAITSEKNEVRLQEDGTVADALQRRPDLRFGSVKVDGEKSNVSLSSMSAAAVESIEVLKSVTPDLDADSLGGSVHVKTRPAFEQKTRTVQGRLTYQINPEINDFDVKGTMTVGTAFGGDHQWGTLLTVRGEHDTGGSDSRRIDWKDLDTPDGTLRVIDRKRLDQWRATFGGRRDL